jgi:hypothetical protein
MVKRKIVKFGIAEGIRRTKGSDNESNKIIIKFKEAEFLTSVLLLKTF